MADNLKTYSVVIQWNDNQRDEGTYGDTVRARDGDHAERIVRARMLRNQWAEWAKIDPSMSKSEVADMYAVQTWQGVQYFGACHECTEGAIWKAADMESLLREAVEAWPQFDTDSAPLAPGCIPDEAEPVNGGDLVEWFGEWRAKAKALTDNL